MLVSIIAPIFNHEKYLLDCLLSIFDQTWPRLELIAIDDMSGDGSYGRAKSLAGMAWVKQRFERVIVERNPANLGAARTINKAIGKSAGDVIMVVNTDDLYAPERVARCVEAIRSGHDMVFSDIEFIDGDGRDVFENHAWQFRSAIDEIAMFPTVSASLLGMNRAISTGNFCFTRRLFDQAGPFRPLQYCHDWDFILAASLLSEPAFLAERLYYYRLHETNSFRSLFALAETESRICLERYFGAIVRGSIANPKLKAIAASDALWDRLVAHCGPVVAQEWQRAKTGKAPRHDLRAPRTGEDEDTASATDGVRTAPSLAEQLKSRIQEDILVIGCGGDIHHDGWIGANSILRMRAPPGAGGLQAKFYVPKSRSARTLIATIRSGETEVRRVSFPLRPGTVNQVVIDQVPLARNFDLALTIVGADRTEGDMRVLGAVLVDLGVYGNSGADRDIEAANPLAVI